MIKVIFDKGEFNCNVSKVNCYSTIILFGQCIRLSKFRGNVTVQCQNKTVFLKYLMPRRRGKDVTFFGILLGFCYEMEKKNSFSFLREMVQTPRKWSTHANCMIFSLFRATFEYFP